MIARYPSPVWGRGSRASQSLGRTRRRASTRIAATNYDLATGAYRRRIATLS